LYCSFFGADLASILQTPFTGFGSWRAGLLRAHLQCEQTDVDRVFDALTREPNGGLMVLPDISMTNYREAIIALAARYRVPAVYPFRYFAASGGLMSYGSDVTEVFRRAAGYVDRILKGTSPGELPIQAPNKYELVINLKTAKTLGLEVPPALLARADEVIE
jgi:putative ABC transport system substrate-binding protein